MANAEGESHASSGHKLGQLVGDWFEQFFVQPLLEQVANRLGLYFDSRFHSRSARGEKLVWNDEDGNEVDYDFVMELGGTDEQLGVPVAFVERFWRRGARHSKDKARDDSGKLLPMRDVHPTARFLGIVAGGDFTTPARQLVHHRGIDLFYIPKAKIVAAFAGMGLGIDYPDRAPEVEKAKLADAFERGLTKSANTKAAKRLRELVGETSIASYVDRVRAAMGALPQEIRFIARRDSAAVVFERIDEATAYLARPQFDFAQPAESYVYQITYSDGSEFERTVATIGELRSLHDQIERLAKHMTAITSR